MIKKIILLIIFLTGNQLFCDTVMIETIGDVPSGNRSINSKELLIRMETGVMDSLFDGGHLFFNVNNSSGGINSENTQKSLIRSRNSGAQWLLRLIPGEEKVTCNFYNLSTLELIDEFIITRKDVGERADYKEFYFEAGKLAGNSIVTIINSP